MSESVHLTGRQIAAGRVLVGIGQAELAASSSVSTATLRRMEASPGEVIGMPNNVAAVRRALEAAGVIFVAENGDGPGVRLRKATVRNNDPSDGGLKICPECQHAFQGNGWDGIDAHWKAKHETAMPYLEAWPLIKAGTYKPR